ncbi:uncharacterized protein [Oryza sativa Japonica Group]|uniref:Os06g0183700 protein n=2 Tax=Oryza sativa subsp. japonica TaxID=39947 RepID=Q5SML1_ORYSJ|nr:uncharacterized protein LOC4340322 isoform X1 [Oryza sativa Japonica Group]BAD72508.1 unknown protein [Oryza sativa Japonica Group]BAD72545.1 unknown protein [Oryza sativa Japonica Group]BAH01165.1 unnamed protein product [Oryza sativa Japonica Group]BAS96487.1 Os06g0183700 [Oryza sativa Japonica Group]
MEVEAARRSKRPPWSRTVAVQVALCVAMYAAFSLGEPRFHRNRGRGGGGGVEASLGRGGRGGVSFLSVAGGARPAAEQARLLRQMESIAKAYKVKFVVDVAQLGEEDPLWQNGSLYFQALKIPWYSTTSSHGQIIGNFLKRVMMPYDQSLEIIGMDTGSLQEPIHDGKIRASSREQIKWLEQSIAATSSNWKIVVGYDPFFVCAEAHTLETTKLYEPLQRIFAKYGVNAYISTGGHCGYFRQDNSMLYIGNPSPDDLTSSDGFLLHIVNLLEMESLLINLEGKVVERFVVNHHRLEAL